MTTIRALVLDYGGVVFHEDPADFDAIGTRHGLGAGELWSAFHSIPEYQPSRVGLIGADEFHAVVHQHLADRVGSQAADACFAELKALFAAQAPVRPVMRELLQRLRGVVGLALLSNAPRGHTEKFRQSGVAGLFDFVACSGDVGLAKPDPAAYLHASAGLRMHPGDCLFVDDVAEYVAAARQVGMSALHYHENRHEELLVLLREARLPGA